MAAPIRHMTLVGFHGLDANRGPIRYQSKALGEFSPEDDALTHRQNFVVFTNDEAAKAKLSAYYARRWEGARSFHCTAPTLSMSLIPILNAAFGIVKIFVGISEDGSALGVLPEDRWKFKATLIAVGIAEVCFLGFIVHGVASLYFAMTSPEVELA